MEKTVLSIQDFSCYGKSSLNIALPVYESAHIAATLLPTAILSTQTDGFPDYYQEDLLRAGGEIISRLSGYGISFNAIQSGYLASGGHYQLLERAQKELSHPDTLFIVDPVLGDGGKLYDAFGKEDVDHMRSLIANASIITPNYTEACLLTGCPCLPVLNDADIAELLKKLAFLTPQSIVITSVPLAVGALGNVAFDGKESRTFAFSDLGLSYPGSGDLFASLLTSFLLHKTPFFVAVKWAGVGCEIALKRSADDKRERRLGVDIYPIFSYMREKLI